MSPAAAPAGGVGGFPIGSEAYWTFETLHAVLAQRIEDVSMRLDERHRTQQEEIQTADNNLRSYIDQRAADLMEVGRVRNEMLDERFESQKAAMKAAFEAANAAGLERLRRVEDAATLAHVASEKALRRRAASLDREFHAHLTQYRHETDLVLAANDKAIAKAEDATERRFDSVNAFREQLTEQTNSFMPREVAEASMGELRATVLQLQTRVDTQSGKQQGMSALYGWLVAAVGILISVILAANAIFGTGVN